MKLEQLPDIAVDIRDILSSRMLHRPPTVQITLLNDKFLQVPGPCVREADEGHGVIVTLNNEDAVVPYAVIKDFKILVF